MNDAANTAENNNLTAPMVRALAILNRDGAVFAGANVHKGRVEVVSASTLRGLERRGRVVLSVGPDGGMMARRSS